VSSEGRPAVAVVDGAEGVVAAVTAAGFDVVRVASVDEVEVPGAGAPVAVVVRWPVRHVGLGELGIPLVALIAAEAAPGAEVEATISDALERGAHDVVLSTASATELGARLQAAERTAYAWRELNALSRTDPLTGLSNRHHLDEHLHMVSSLARRQRSVFSLLMIDIDRTRRINDTHGHGSGDVVLAEVARRIVAGLRGEDVAGRWSGEEFVVLLPHTELDGAWRLADRIRGAVCDEPVDLGDSRDVMVTVSVGCAEGFGDDLDDHLRRAHDALDEAKAAGRNKVVADTSPVLG
jgi:diguanylate cyclase (GGDEF)-like protein